MKRYKRKFEEANNFKVLLNYKKENKTFYITTLKGNTYFTQDYSGMIQVLRNLDAKSKINNVENADAILSMVMDPSFGGNLAILVDPNKFRQKVEL